MIIRFFEAAVLADAGHNLSDVGGLGLARLQVHCAPSISVRMVGEMAHSRQASPTLCSCSAIS